MLFVGGLDRAHYFKGLTVLIEALSELRNDDWTLLVIGDGDLMKTFVAQTKAIGISERVKFLGAVSESEKPRFFRAADFHVFPSTDRSEAFGLVVLEAAASGIPTIASNLPGVRSIIQDDQIGILVTPNQSGELKIAIQKLLTDQAERRRLGAAARIRAEKEFAWSPLIDKMEKVYGGLVDRER